MAQAARIAASTLGGILRGDTGLPFTLAALSQVSGLLTTPVLDAEIIERHVAPDLDEKAGAARYPAIYVYCDRIKNELHEKFRSFSGTAELHIEVRVSHDHIDQLHNQMQLYIDAVTDVLDRNRGTWIDGMFYTGGYEIIFNAIKRGGRNFLQTARVQLRVHLSAN
jgi:hypothetical protein